MKKYRILIIFGSIIILGMILSPIKPVRNFFSRIFSPISSRLLNSSGTIGSFFSNIASINELEDENQNLKKQINQLKADIASIKELENENKLLKEQLGFIEKQKDRQFITSKVLSKSISPMLKYINIDKGQKDGVEKNMAVLSQGYLIGKVFESYADYSQVELITSPNIIIPVVLQKSRSTGLLSSDLSGFSINDVPVDEKIEKGENVLTNNLDDNIPANLLIGEVEDIQKFESLLFQNIKVKSPIEFEKLQYVFVLKNI